jgi:hypothetical protein
MTDPDHQADPLSFETFHWEETLGLLEELEADHDLRPDLELGGFVAAGLRVRLPLVQPLGADCGSLADYLEELPLDLGLHLVVLMQAGATSLGLFEAGRELRTKSFKRYVVRGKGRSQATHLKTRGKSRYGSRLRLQNAQLMLDETAERLSDWLGEHGDPELVFYGAPVRLWSDLLRAEPRPAFAPGERLEPALVRIPLDLPVPVTDVLLRTYRALCHGRVERLPG